jgi:adenylosuccinate lyase
MVDIWRTEGYVKLERVLWIAAMRVQKEFGLDIPGEALRAYGIVRDNIDLASIDSRERKLRHDVKARIEEFNHLASVELGRKVEYVHQGFTSRDIGDNVEQMRILQALALVRDRSVAVLNRFADTAKAFATLDMCARTHNVPAQTTTLGKRFANLAEEMLVAFHHLEYVISSYPMRGIKGPVGTQQDMADLLGSAEKARDFEEDLQIEMEWPTLLGSVGQVYPRSLDFEVLSTLTQLASAPANFAKMVRLMAGHELMHEGFGKEQTGSSAMPHKMNSRTCERINGLLHVLGGHLHMVQGLLGDQWFEGDVSCSVVRRVALQGAFMALDGIYESVLTVLGEMEIFPGMIGCELVDYLPYLSTTRILMALVQKGVGRETAHKAIKSAALAGLAFKRAGNKGGTQTFQGELLMNKDLDLSLEEIEDLMKEPEHGLAPEQVAWLCQRVETVTKKYPEAAAYSPGSIL